MHLNADLVDKECNVEDALRVEDNHPIRAATRLVKYWKERKAAFGAERWLRPMTITGNGALTMEDVDVLRSGVMVPLERPSGGMITLVDLARLPKQMDVSSLRIFFYLSSLYKVQAATYGHIIVHVVTSRYVHTCIDVVNST